MRKLVTADILPLIYNYLRSIGLKSFAEKLNNMSGLNLDEQEGILSSKKLQKIVKFYIKNNEKLLEQFQQSDLQEIEDEEEEEEVQEQQKNKNKSKKQKQNKMNGVQKKSVAESSEEESEEEEEVVKQKNSKKNKKQNKIEKKRQQEDSEEDEDEEEEQVIVQKKPQKKVKVAQNVDDVTDTDQTTGAKFFSRIDESRIDSLRDELKDNTFEAKQKFGKGGDEHGRSGWERLKDKRGKDFKKEKGKLKNKAFCGGASIDVNARNGIKLC